ncbi:alpha/beta fold hydrolase [Azospirillum sp.]|uniref:alpha/beta fold hydrolase n=1 Tax=Azospirillum sp. TaxID=34012 RepID=UPI003D74ADE2
MRRRPLLLLVMAVTAAVLVGACTSDPADPLPPVIATPVLGWSVMVANDGTPLPLHTWGVAGQPRAVIVAAHGMNDYGLAFDRPARLWARAGIATYAIDQRGFGKAMERGRWYGGERMADDLVTLVRLVRERHPDAPVYLLGESMGGAVVVMAAARAERGLLSGIVLSAPAVWGTGLRAAVTLDAATILGSLVPDVTVPPLRVANPSTDDPEVLRRMREDPLIIHRTRFQTLAGIVDLMHDARAEARKVRVPVLLMLGDLDVHVPRDGVAALARDLPRDTRIALYPAGRHLLMRTLDGDRVTQDVAAWVLDTRRALPSGADLRAQACPTLMINPRRGCPQTRVVTNPRAPQPAADGKAGNRLPTPATAPRT